MVTHYINVQHRKVDGWLADVSSLLIARLAAVLEEKGEQGASVEIGAHHGRLFILLHLASTGQRDLVIDVFGSQHLNIDHSGKGDKAAFLRNLARFGGDPGRVQILEKSSLEVQPAEIIENVGHPVLFSIDGGHTTECVHNDMSLADATLAEHGIVILDDFFNEFWPEVAVGTMSFLQESGSRLRPFAVSPGKLYFCRPGHQAFFHSAIKDHFSQRYVDKEAQIFGSQVLVVGVRDERRNWRTRLAWTVIESAIGRRFGMQRWLPPKFSRPV